MEYVVVKPLDGPRQSLAVRWIGYANKLASRHCPDHSDRDDARGRALLALCLAAAGWQEDRPWLPYLAACVCRAVRGRRHHRDIPCVPLESDPPARVAAANSAEEAEKARCLLNVTRLTPGERGVVEATLAGESLAEAGRRLGVSRERARQLEAAALRKLKGAAG